MTRFLLDTNVISEAIRATPSPKLLDWLGEQDDADLFTSSLTIAELWRGIYQMPEGNKRRKLESWASGPEGPSSAFGGRILPFDESAALLWARFMAEGIRIGQPRSALDMIIAAVAEANDCVVVTYNIRHFYPVVETLDLSQV